jgi:hypothetical protein
MSVISLLLIFYLSITSFSKSPYSQSYSLIADETIYTYLTPMNFELWLHDLKACRKGGHGRDLILFGCSISLLQLIRETTRDHQGHPRLSVKIET